MKRYAFLLFLFMIGILMPGFGQSAYNGYRFVSNSRSIILPCRIINNLLLVQVSLNGSSPKWFILDTGVQHTLLTDWPAGEDLPLTLSQQVAVTGLGEGQSVTAFRSWGNTMELAGIYAANQDILVLADHQLNLSETIGLPVYGIIGYPFFASFDVAIDYRHQQLRLYQPGAWKPRKRYQTLDLHFHRNKPYTHLSIVQQDGSTVSSSFLIDLGASHALSLYTFANPDIYLPSPALPALLGKGLGGSLQGHIARIGKVKLGNVSLQSPIVSFPDSSSVQTQSTDTDFCSGSIGGESLRRFRVVLSYHRKAMYLKPTIAIRDAFRHNTSGMEIIAPLPGYPVYLIEAVHPGSPAEISGVQPGDQLLYVNGAHTNTLTLQETIHAVNGRAGKRLRVTVIRQGTFYRHVLQLQDDI